MPRAPHRSYPSVVAYGASLPDGWRSFAECAVNGRLIRDLRTRGAFDGLDGVPPEVAAVMTTEQEWVPEALAVAAFLAIRDARFPGPSGESDFLDWVDAVNHAILRAQQSQLPELTPSVAITWIPSVWASFHRGTPMTVLAQTETDAEISFAHPAALFPRAWMESRRRTLTAALVRAGAVQPSVTARVAPGLGTHFSLRWT